MQRRHHLIAVLLPLLALGGVQATTDSAAAARPPAVTAVKPDSGPLVGGTRVTILGSGFRASPVVKFGSLRATHVTVVSSSKLKVTVPTRPRGSDPLTADVRVTTAAGTSARVKADRFSFLAAPKITSATPSTGPAAGGTRVVLEGARFQNVSAVTFDGVRGTDIESTGTTQVAVTAPVHVPGPTTVRLVTPQGRASSTFTYVGVPAVSDVTPAHGSMRGGTVVTLSGSGFTDATQVTFGGVPATGFTVDSDSTITATTPSRGSAGPVDTQVSTPTGSSATTTDDRFTYGIIDFTIPPGTGAGAWNSLDDPVRGRVGDVVHFLNADSAPHRLHSSPDTPGLHWATDLPPGASLDWPLTGTCTLLDVVYDHDYTTDARFYIVVDAPS